ncbi:MAG: helix-hairpin-helix domain-containing protein [Treponema sp.]|jgi:uncharacterized protein|nr:helix-hairpin-helix domain-containing protein [Treponema sp.]
MNLDKGFIDELKVDGDALVRRVGEKLGLKTGQVAAVTGLLAEGSTVPFIARYRKERTGGLDEVQVRSIEHLFGAAMNLETRRLEIIRAVYNQGKLTEPLYENLSAAVSAAELEDMYAPYKRKKKTRGMLALERGLGPLAAAMKELENAALLARAAEFVRLPVENAQEGGEKPEDGAGLAVPTVQDALQGAMDIIAEESSQDTKNRAVVKAFYCRDGRIIVKARQDRTAEEKGDAEAKKGAGEAKKASTYQMYADYEEPLSRIKAHRILAINRGEREGFLDVTVDVDENAAVQLLQKACELHNDYHKTAIEDGLKRLLSPAVIREIRGDQNEAADDHGISVFAENLKNLLMQQPIKGTRVLGIDPGIRTGTKCALLDDTGKYLGSFVIYNHRPEEAKKLLLEGIKRYDIQLAAVGNGTGSRDVQELVSQVITENNLELLYTVVDEDGASVYSASDIAREEFPDLDLTIRGAVSIGRRLQDPLAELVKIDPKSIGVGLYQHDLNQRKLSESLDEVVSSVVNNVGVNLNTASVSLLKYVSGINGPLARKIVSYRNEKGRIESREELVTVSGMGPKSYEQCAGFLKIPESAEPLDNTWVHPENYGVAREIRSILGSSTVTGSLSSVTITELKEKYGVGDATIGDIVEELKKPNRDPRSDYPKPVTRKGIMNFEDLAEGMTVTGKIKNVVDFGAFVDLGIKETALVHISELANHFVKNPLETVKVGDVLEFKIISRDVERRRIGLSRKLSGPPGSGAAGSSALGSAAAGSGALNSGTVRHENSGPAPAGPGLSGPVPAKSAGHGQTKTGPETARGGTPAPRHGRERLRVESGPKGPAAASAGAPRPMPRPSAGFGQRPAPRPAADDDGTMYNPFAEALKNRVPPRAGKNNGTKHNITEKNNTTDKKK